MQGDYLPSGRWQLRAFPKVPGSIPGLDSCITDWPPAVVAEILRQKQLAWVCDTLARHSDAGYLAPVLNHQVFAYFRREEFAGKRLLDFGCGDGASTFCLAKTLPGAEVVGVDLSSDNIERAQWIQQLHNLRNVRFLQSPTPESLPPGTGQFDFVMLSAVFEHLLPKERKTVVPLIWSVLKPGGVIFINQTPHRFFPYEHHSTQLWFINYLPDRWAHKLTVKLTRHKSPDWNVHLRGGIRGGTEGEIIQCLTSGKRQNAVILQPRYSGLKSRAGYWLSCTSPGLRLLKKVIAAFFHLSDRLLGTVPSINVDVVIQKLQ